jgi:hypothetical protein
VDQGVLPVLLTLVFLSRQRFFNKTYLYDCEVRSAGDAPLLAELDVMFTLGRYFGVGEVKADRGFDLLQVDRLLEVASRVRADILLFSTQRPRESEEVKTLVEHLATRSLSIPAFVIPGEVLFCDELIDITKYFELQPVRPAFEWADSGVSVYLSDGRRSGVEKNERLQIPASR